MMTEKEMCDIDRTDSAAPHHFRKLLLVIFRSMGNDVCNMQCLST